MADTIHQGRNIKRFREMLGLKQEGLAYELGEDWNQKKVSLLEQKEIIDEVLLEQVAKVLKVPAEAIKRFDEATAINNIQNNYDSSVINSQISYHFNTIEKWIEALDENKKLYERIIQVEREKNEQLLKFIDSRKNL